MFLYHKHKLYNLNFVKAIRINYPLYGDHGKCTREVFLDFGDGGEVCLKIFDTEELAQKFLDDEVVKKLLTKGEVVVL